MWYDSQFATLCSISYRNHGETLESLHLNQAKLEGIQQDLVVMETELEDTKKRKSELLRELQNLKHHVKG